MSRIRTFIAVDIGDALRQRTAQLQQKLARAAPEVKWVEASNMHVTLLFLGEVNELDLVPICRILKEQTSGFPSFTLDIGGLGAFPTVRRPKILWAGIQEGADDLKQLHQRLEQPLMELGCYRREDRAYSPHLTLGRLTEDDRAEAWGPIIAEHADWHGGSVQIDKILVMSSELRRSGPAYTVIGRAHLDGTAKSDDDD
jgi:RNA 2',3'-cyclic 3'-phosphodiesterase